MGISIRYWKVLVLVIGLFRVRVIAWAAKQFHVGGHNRIFSDTAYYKVLINEKINEKSTYPFV